VQLRSYYCHNKRTRRSSSAAGAHAAASVRADIECPNVFLSTTRLSLGTTYMGVEIHRTVNLCPTARLRSSLRSLKTLPGRIQSRSRRSKARFTPKSGSWLQ
jgi:hypothetical protein